MNDVCLLSFAVVRTKSVALGGSAAVLLLLEVFIHFFGVQTSFQILELFNQFMDLPNCFLPVLYLEGFQSAW